VTHFTERELQQWSATGPGEAGPRLVEHLAACPACATRYAAAIRSLPVSAEPVSPDEARAFAATAYAIPARTSAVVPFRARARWFVPLAAAAAVIAAIGIPYLTTRRPAPNGEAVFRGGALHSLEPAGAVDRAASFAWSSAIPAATYRLEVGDATGVIVTRQTASSTLQLTSDEAQRLKAGVDYWWTVTALDRDGRTLGSSQRQAFTIRTR
jgi:hypothetical protein